MKCLALDTTTTISSIAIADEKGMMAEYNFAHHMDLSRRLMPDIVTMLKDNGMEMNDVEAIGVSLGPGSFTGLRIGVVTAKSLAQVLDVPIVGIPSLDLLAYQFEHMRGSMICPIVKVRKSEVYYSFFRAHGDSLERVSGYEAETVEMLISQAKEFGAEKIIFCGDALADNAPTLIDGLGEQAVLTPQWLSYPKASLLAIKALKMISAGDIPDPATVLPFYIRKSTPEIRYDEAHKKL
ncbi:MAG: tRNA (adenosine(37)-N6)-threonylcarbamoyltransferase complex dimerization subunit type 1 TsaB [Armatimonadota bacterium]